MVCRTKCKFGGKRNPLITFGLCQDRSSSTEITETVFALSDGEGAILEGSKYATIYLSIRVQVELIGEGQR